MSIQVADGFGLKAKKYLDNRQSFDTISEMANFADTNLPDGFITYNNEDGKRYEFNSSNSIDVTLGKWREYTISSSNLPSWKSTKDYVVGDIVMYDGRKYQTIKNHTSGTDFDTDKDNWIELSETYILLTVAQYEYMRTNNLLEDKLYIKIDDNNSGSGSGSSSGAGNLSNMPSISFNNKNIVSAGEIEFSNWKTSTNYKIDDKVVINKTLYKCIIAHTSSDFDTDLTNGNWEVYIGGSGMEHKILTQSEYDTLIASNKIDDNVIYIVTDGGNNSDYALKEDVYKKDYITTYTFCQSTDAGALEIVADGSLTDSTIQVELSTVQAILATANIGDYVLSNTTVDVTNDPLFVKVTEIMDTLNSSYTDRPLSAYQGYVLAQKFVKDLYITNNNILTLEYLNGNKFTYDLSTFLHNVINSIGYGKVIACDKLPTCKDNGNGTYTITYEKDSVQYTADSKNTWFYYQKTTTDASGGSVTSWYQTLFVDGVEVTILAGAIADTIKIDSTTKHWIVNGKDTGILAQGTGPIIEPNANNNDAIFKVDIKNYDYNTQSYITTTSDNLHGRDSVQVPLNGFYKVYVENGTLVCEVQDGATPPPLALEIINGQQCLTYTMGGTIQGTKI